jgi:hypothetical protein
VGDMVRSACRVVQPAFRWHCFMVYTTVVPFLLGRYATLNKKSGDVQTLAFHI